MTRTSSGQALGVLRSIVEHHQYAKIHSRNIDAQTASTMLKVYD